jgi:kynurenine 3-monooxygenase
MRIVVVGASSGTGRQVAEQGVQRGHEIVAVSRSGAGLPGVTDVRGDATEPDVLATAFADGVDAVVLAIGGTKGTHHNRSVVTKAVLDALPSSLTRVVVHSSLGVGDSQRFLPKGMALLTSVVLRTALADHAEQEELVRASGRPWTIVRPGGLTDKPASGRIVALEEPAPFTSVIPRADVAHFILDCLEDPATIGRTYALGTPA